MSALTMLLGALRSTSVKLAVGQGQLVVQTGVEVGGLVDSIEHVADQLL